MRGAEMDARTARLEWSSKIAGRKLCRVTGLGLDRHKASTHCSFVIKSAQTQARNPIKTLQKAAEEREGGSRGSAGRPERAWRGGLGCRTRLTKYKSFSLCNSLISTGQGQRQAAGSLPSPPAPLGRAGQVSSPASAPKSLARSHCEFGHVSSVWLRGWVHGRGCSWAWSCLGLSNSSPIRPPKPATTQGPFQLFK